MPDWLSHILIGLIAAEVFNIDKKGLVTLGSLLPDFAVKVYLLSFFFPVNGNILFVSSLYHSQSWGLLFRGFWRRFSGMNGKKPIFALRLDSCCTLSQTALQEDMAMEYFFILFPTAFFHSIYFGQTSTG